MLIILAVLPSVFIGTIIYKNDVVEKEPKEFLRKLDSLHEREVYARIELMTFDELPIETIEGKITTGSINIDGSSAVRRSCSLTMVTND